MTGRQHAVYQDRKLRQLNGIQSSFFSLVTPVLFLLWHSLLEDISAETYFFSFFLSSFLFFFLHLATSLLQLPDLTYLWLPVFNVTPIYNNELIASCLTIQLLGKGGGTWLFDFHFLLNFECPLPFYCVPVTVSCIDGQEANMQLPWCAAFPYLLVGSFTRRVRCHKHPVGFATAATKIWSPTHNHDQLCLSQQTTTTGTSTLGLCGGVWELPPHHLCTSFRCGWMMHTNLLILKYLLRCSVRFSKSISSRQLGYSYCST